MFGIKTRLKKWHDASRAFRKTTRILRDEFALYRTMEMQRCVDKDGDFLPWYTYPAIEYIKRLDLSDKTVFEYGPGYSTLFWAKRVKHVVAVEEERKWYDIIKDKMPSNVELHHADNPKDYAGVINKYDRKFDIIINDGVWRVDCATASRDKLADGGFVILDNSDWCYKTAAMLREQDLIEVDMSGFSPINAYTGTTSFFFSRSFTPKPNQDRHPGHGIGAWHITQAELEEWLQG